MNNFVPSKQASVPVGEISSVSALPPGGSVKRPGRGGARVFAFAKRIVGIGLAAAWITSLGAQTGGTPVYSIFAPATGVQSNTQQGTAVAVGGGFVAVGCPYDSLTDTRVGVVKVYSSSNGALLYVLRCPSPAQGELFGSALAMSGPRLVVGDPNYTPSSPYSASGRVYVYDLASATPPTPIVTLENPTPRSTDRFGFSVSISGNIVVTGVPYHTVSGVSNAGCAYVFDLSSATPGTAKYTLQKTTPANGDNFGYSVGVSGNRIVVGVPNDSPSSNFQRAGAAYLFDLTTSAPATAVFRFINPNGTTAANDSYGNAVAISGDWVAIGAYSGGDGNGGDGSGAVYVYNLGGATATTPFATLRDPKKPGTAYSGFFGSAVAVDGPRVVVGAPYENLSGVQQAGSVFEFNMSSSTPATTTLIIDNPTPVYMDRFGTAVAITGSQVIVGAPFDDLVIGTATYTDAGSAYIFNNTTAPSFTLNATSPTANDRFGYAVSTSVGYLAVGTPSDPTTGSLSGSVTVYVLSGGNPLSAYLTIPNPDPAHISFFGRSVSMSGTLVAIGGMYNNGTGTDPGIVYVFNVRAKHPLDPYAILNNPYPGLYYQFGSALALAGSRLVVGMASGQQNYGSAFAYDLNVGTSPTATLYNPDAAPNDGFGYSVALFGTTAVVGSFGYSVGSTPSVGRVYVYNLGATNPGYVSAIIDNPNPVANSRLGDAVAISGTRIVVGMPHYNVGTALGRALVFDLASTTPNTPIAILNHPYNGYNDSFGTSVAISGQLVVVGGPDDPLTDPNNLSSAGRAFVFSLAGTNPGTPIRVFDNPTPQSHETFSASVSIDDATVVVGTPGENTVAPGKGAVYSYNLTATLQVAANPAAGGTVSGGGGTYTIGSSQTISATANSGWSFVGWSDGSTQNPRTVGVPGDGTVFKANFAPANYNAWQSYYFTAQQIANPAISGPTANPSGDGVPNFFKFYFGFNPTTPLSQADRAALPTLIQSFDGGNPVVLFTFRRNAAAAGVPVNLQLLTGTTTTAWTNIVPDATTVSTTDPVTGFQTVTMKISVAGRTRMLLRLQAAP